MDWKILTEQRPPNNNGVPKNYAVESFSGKRDVALYGSSGYANEPNSFFEPEHKRFKAKDIFLWCEIDSLLF